MEYSILTLLISTATAICGAIGFMEMRLNKMYSQLKEKIDDKQQLNTVVQQELKEHIVRLEEKIDMLIKLNIRTNNEYKQ